MRRKGSGSPPRSTGCASGSLPAATSSIQYVAIMNAARFELSANDDDALVYNDSIASIIVPEDGKYIIQIRDAAYTGDGKAYYLLNIGKFPRPRGIVPSGGKPGEKLAVKFLGDVGGEFVQEFQLPARAAERPLLTSMSRTAAGSLRRRICSAISELTNVIEQEPNECHRPGHGSAAVPAPVAFNGCLDKPGDQDYFKFTATKGQVFDVELFGRRLRSAIDGVLYVCNKDGGGMAGNDDSRGAGQLHPLDLSQRRRVFDPRPRPPPRRRTVVHLSRRDDSGRPKVIASTVDFERYVQPQLVVPSGGGVGVQVTVTRQDVGGPIAFRQRRPPGRREHRVPPRCSAAAAMPGRPLRRARRADRRQVLEDPGPHRRSGEA